MSSKLFGCKLAFFVTALTCLTGSFVAGQEEPTLQTLSSTRTYERCSVYSYSCVDKKNKCKGDFYSYESMERCNNGNKSESCCKMPLHCSNTTGKCVADNSGDSCTSDSDCLKNYFGSGLNVCLKREGAQALCVVQGNVGDSCLINDDCYGPMQCVAGVCEGADEGNVCAPTVPGTAVSGTTGFSCKVGLYCDPASLVCKPRVAAGERCSYNYMCGNGLVCNSGECTPRYSLSANDNCSVHNKNNNNMFFFSLTHTFYIKSVLDMRRYTK